jgi:hypothetical protein
MPYRLSQQFRNTLDKRSVLIRIFLFYLINNLGLQKLRW